MKRKTLSREQILNADDLETRWVPVGEWEKGAELLVTAWTARTRDQFDELLVKFSAAGKQDKNPRAIMVALSVIDEETREPIFSIDDVEALSKKNQATMNRLFQAVAELNPLNDKSIKATAKNS